MNTRQILFKTIIIFTLALFSHSSINAQEQESEKKVESSADTIKTKSTPEKIDYKSEKIFDTIAEKFGITIDPEYKEKRHLIIPAYKDDHLLPTGYIQAIEKGEPYISLWKIEHDFGKDIDAEKALKKILKKYPKNVKAHWVMALNYFLRGEGLPRLDEKGRELEFAKGREWGKKCVKLDPQNINCRLFLGSNTGRMITNSGGLTKAWYASEIHDTFKAGAKSKAHYRFGNSMTSLGTVYHALGAVYRMVPDSFLVKLFFGVRGDIKKSIHYHKLAVATKPSRIPYVTELAASYLCSFDRDEDQKALEAGKKELKRCLSLKPRMKIEVMSQEDCGKLLKTPELACGYSRDRQQETDIDKLKEMHKKKK